MRERRKRGTVGRSRAVLVLERSLARAWFNRRTALRKVTGSFRVVRGAPCFREKRIEEPFGLLKAKAVGDGLGTLTEKRKDGGTLALQRAYVAGRCGRWKEELISTAGNRTA